MPAPKELARQNIDKLLTACGWVIQKYKQLYLSAGRGIAIREVPLKEGRCDYLLLIDRKPAAEKLWTYEPRTKRYATNAITKREFDASALLRIIALVST